MAEHESMNHPSGLRETEVPGDESAPGPEETLGSYFELVGDCVEAVQKMPSRKFNSEQCEYLAEKLQVVVQSASLFSVVSCGRCHRPGSSEDMGRRVELFKFVLAEAREIESFIQGCCKDGWIHAAMTLTNVSEYVSSIGFNLELCRVAFGKEIAATGSLTLDQVANISRVEVEIVKKTFADLDTLVAKVLQVLTEKSLSTEENHLAIYLLQSLHRVKPISLSILGSSWWSIINQGSVLGNLFKRVNPIERLGKGASATVYKAMWLGTPIAKKTFLGRNNPDFKGEVEILAGLCHPNITSMFCCAEHKQSCSITMELMDEDLHDLIQKRCEKCNGNSNSPPFTTLEAVDIMLQVGEGMNYLHNQVMPSIVCRDLKSSNIIVKCVSGRESEIRHVHAKVIDFDSRR